MPSPSTTSGPLLRLTSLTVRGLRSIRHLDLPSMGLGWTDGFPPVAVVGGANGSGKTTLLRLIAAAGDAVAGRLRAFPADLTPDECVIDLGIGDGVAAPVDLRVMVGGAHFTAAHAFRDSVVFNTPSSDGGIPARGRAREFPKRVGDPEDFRSSAFPRIVFIPSEERDLIMPKVAFKAPGKLMDTAGFVARWRRNDRNSWAGSVEELLHSARWADLNAKEEGRPDLANNFERYTTAFADLTRGAKRLVWTPHGDLVVALAGGAQHELDKLSAGERQALLLLAELRRLWRPGSLILIDELELHLHDAWQGKLYEAIRAMQRELGGQVILATQSHALFSMAEQGTRALLGREGLR